MLACPAAAPRFDERGRFCTHPSSPARPPPTNTRLQELIQGLEALFSELDVNARWVCVCVGGGGGGGGGGGRGGGGAAHAVAAQGVQRLPLECLCSHPLCTRVPCACFRSGSVSMDELVSGLDRLGYDIRMDGALPVCMEGWVNGWMDSGASQRLFLDGPFCCALAGDAPTIAWAYFSTASNQPTRPTPRGGPPDAAHRHHPTRPSSSRSN